MDDVYLYIIGGAVVAGLLMFLNKKREKTTVASFLQDAQSSKPMLMQASVEKKLRTLKTVLFLNKTTSLSPPKPPMSETKKQGMIAALNELEKSYANGSITLKAYDDQLHLLVMKLQR